MAAERYGDDISGFWGPEEESGVEPTHAALTAIDLSGGSPAAGNGHGNGVRAAGADAHGDLARLAQAISGHRAGGVTRAELEAMRSDLEDAFTQQLAVALYELMAASNDRLASVEGHIDERLHDIGQRVNEAADAQAKLAASVEQNISQRLHQIDERVNEAADEQARLAKSVAMHQRSSKRSEAVLSDLAATRDQILGPVDGFVTFQREMRHEVGRLGDIVATRLAGRADGEAENRSGDPAQQSDVLESGGALAVGATDAPAEISERISAMQADVAALHEAVSELRQAVERQARRARGRRNRNG